jgi:ABC-2 type transport system permease protein
VSAPKALRPTPTFLGAIRGIWLFTWRPQATWRRLPLLLVGLLALPSLVYLTTPPQQARPKHDSPLGDPATPVNRFARQCERAGTTLSAEQRNQLLGIFTEEFARTDATPVNGQSADAAAARERAEIKACYARIHARAETVLDETQFNRFRNYEKLASAQGQQRVRPRWGRTEPFYHWLIDFYFFVILPLQCVRGSGGLIRDELQADTLGFLLTRPLSRARLLVLKYVSQTAWLQIILLVETLLLFLAGSLRQMPALGSLLPLFLAAQFLAVPAWSALGLFLGQVSKRYLAIALLYGLIVEMGIGRIPTNINTLSLVRHLKTLLAHNPALQTLYAWSGVRVPFSVGALLFAAGLFLALAALLFTFKEYHQNAEMQK